MDPHAEYTRELAERRKLRENAEQLFRRIGTARLATGGAGAVVLALALGWALISAWWLIPPALLFLALVFWHQFVYARLAAARRAVEFYEKGLARIEDRWQGHGECGERFRTADHVYADDLDVLGKGSLYELLCTVRTTAAEEMLARWLLAPAAPEVLEKRQHAIAELRERIALREDLFLAGELARRDVQPAALIEWGASEPVIFPRALAMVAPVLASVTALLLVLCLAGVARAWPFLLALLIEMGLILVLRGKVNRVEEAVEEPARALDLLAAVLHRFERERFELPHLTGLRAGLESAIPASRHIERLERYAARLEWTHNQFFGPIAAVLLWREQIAMRIEVWRREHGPHLERWLNSVAELEVLCALAAYAWEHPHDVFPQIESGKVFAAEGIAHPLMREGTAVANDLTLGEGTDLLIVSGSNMSGKSTLLRAAGLNAVLALAGAPVRARKLRIGSLAVGASIRVVDSLADGRSRFLAEITRLRQLMDIAGDGRILLFLIDELLSGTNSHDRRIGAEAVLRSLLERGGIGLATTHDLALTAISETLSPLVKNIHFADVFSGGNLVFDYRLRDGVVLRSNALELMRSVGLTV